MKSPFTDGTATLYTESMEITFRKEHFTAIAQFYKCDDTGEEFTTTDQDELTINQVYNQYREKYGIPFVDEINEILERYNLSASKIENRISPLCEVNTSFLEQLLDTKNLTRNSSQ